MRRGKLRDDQRFWSLLPPARGRATDVHQLADGLWTATQPLLVPGGDAGLRLTAMRMADGSLWASLVVAFASARFDLVDVAAMRGCIWRQWARRTADCGWVNPMINSLIIQRGAPLKSAIDATRHDVCNHRGHGQCPWCHGSDSRHTPAAAEVLTWTTGRSALRLSNGQRAFCRLIRTH